MREESAAVVIMPVCGTKQSNDSLARSDYYEASAPPGGRQPATGLPAAGLAARREGRPRAVPTFTTESIKKLGARLYPGSLAMPTPQAFSMASPPDLKTGFGVDPAEAGPRAANPAHIRQV